MAVIPVENIGELVGQVTELAESAMKERNQAYDAINRVTDSLAKLIQNLKDDKARIAEAKADESEPESESDDEDNPEFKKAKQRIIRDKIPIKWYAHANDNKGSYRFKLPNGRVRQNVDLVALLATWDQNVPKKRRPRRR